MNWNIDDNNIQKQETKVRKVRTFIAVILAFVGLSFLFSQLAPLAYSYYQGYKLMKTGSETLSPVAGSYKREIEGKIAYYDPGKSYWENFLQRASNSGQSVYGVNNDSATNNAVIVNTNYEGSLKLNIPKIEINNLHITPNVDSFDESIYNQTLKNGLAHFQGTPIPGDGGNAFVYGHSAIEQFFKYNQDNPEVAFSKLEKVEIGDKVEVVRDDGSGPKKMTYTVRKKKIVEPTDFSILNPVNNKHTLTLMTCWPNGLGTKRLIVIAHLDA